MMFSRLSSVLLLALTVNVHGQAFRQHENAVKHVRSNQDDRDLFWLRYLEDLGGSVPSNDGKGGTGKGVFSKKKKKGSMGKAEMDKGGMTMGEGGKGDKKKKEKKTKEDKKGVKGDKKQKKVKGGKAGSMGGKGDSNDTAAPAAAPTKETKVKKKSKGSTASPSAVPSTAPSAIPTASSKGKGGKGKRM